ncbi:MAG: SDR family oxidoreductase [Halothece sp. Uz-M2-17]|nr:SDR family oxidoreductase [Halothece sp. Uz-M2-17]
MSDRSVLITGVAGGIGLATAQKFHSSGWTVFGVDIQDKHELAGVDYYFKGDVSDLDQVTAIIEQIKQKTKQLDALVNNAATQICKPLLEMTVSEWDQTMAVNLRAAFLWVRESYPLLKSGQGSIVNVSSVHAIATSDQIAAYATSKGGLVAFTRACAIEFANDGIRVNAILPGAVNTPMLKAGLTRGHLSADNLEKQLQQLNQKTVIGRVGTPEEIAQSIYFLADSNQLSFMTGQTLVIDGGATAKLSTE